MSIKSFNLNEIVSVKYESEFESGRFYISEERSLIDWFLGKPKEKVIRCFYSYSSVSFKQLPTGCIIRGDKIFIKASVEINFSDGQYQIKYFETNEDALEFKDSLTKNSFITL